MANALNDIIPTLYEASYRNSREIIGMIPAVMRDPRTARAAIGQTIDVPIPQVGEARNIAPGHINPNAGDATIPTVQVTMQKARAIDVRWNGEEERAVGFTGTFNPILAGQLQEAMRKLSNEIEADLIALAKASASRVTGTAGTAPLGTAGDLSPLADLARILDENGAPLNDRQFVASSATMANARGKQTILLKTNEAGSDDMLRNGMTDRVSGFAWRYSPQIGLHVSGTGTGYLVNSAAGLAVGDRAIPVDTGTGTIIAGDVVSFAADSANRYVAATALSAGVFRIHRPGIRTAIPDDNAVTVGASDTPTFGFDRSALLLAMRPPAVPDGGDSADDAYVLTDDYSGIPFEIRVYREYRQRRIEVALAWGVNALNTAHIAMLLG